MPDFWDKQILKAEQAAAGGQYAKAEEILSELIIFTESKPREDKRKFIVLEIMADLMDAQKRYQEVEKYLLRALELRKERYGVLHRRYADGLARLAGFYYEHERYKDAEPLSREVLHIHEGLYGSDSEEVGRSSGQLAETLHTIGNVEEAEELYKRAINIRKELAGTLDSESVNLIQRYAELLGAAGRKDEADFLMASAQGRVSGIFKVIKVPRKGR